MPDLHDIAASLSPDVIICTLDADHEVAKNPREGSYVKLNRQEAFLLRQLDGKTSYGDITAAFEQHFGEGLTCDELHGFVTMAQKRSLVQRTDKSGNVPGIEAENGSKGVAALIGRCYQGARKQSPLYFRIKLFDPERLLTWLEPRTQWLFSRTLAIAAVVAGGAAVVVTFANRSELVTLWSTNLGWKTFAVTWLTTIVVTICHEFGHGLACKREGGAVHEMGVLWIFFTPCLFCNVSDAWLLPSRRKRLLISMAGTYIDFLIWIVAVFVWRVTLQDTTLNYVSWIVVTTCVVRVLFNMNPLMRLDGYYALGDLLGVHNLRRRGRKRWMDFVRWMLWGGPRPQREADAKTLLIYGCASWTFKVLFLGFLYFHLSKYLNSLVGIAGIVTTTGVFAKFSKRYFQGSLGEDFMNMFSKRKKRVLFWGAIALTLMLLPIYDRAGGQFQVRPVVRWEVRAPVAGFLRDVTLHEGDRVSAGVAFARMEVSELHSRIARKQAEIHEAEAQLRRLEAGPRAEEVAEQSQRVARAAAWRDLANHDLERARMAFQEEIAQLDLAILQAKSELEYRDTYFQQASLLYESGGLAGQQLRAEKKNRDEADAGLQQARAKKRAREAEGVLKYEGELARREKDLADTEATLTLLEAGTRVEEIEAERARLLRLREEFRHLHEQQEKQAVTCPVSGMITTARLEEKIGQYFEKGAIICVVEDLSNLEAEIEVSEQDARVLVPGHRVILKPRSMTLSSLEVQVDRIAPVAQRKENASQSTVTVYCRVDNTDGRLRTGMTGYGRINHQRRPLVWVLANSGLRLLRTEFWW